MFAKTFPSLSEFPFTGFDRCTFMNKNPDNLIQPAWSKSVNSRLSTTAVTWVLMYTTAFAWILVYQRALNFSSRKTETFDTITI